MSTLTIPSEDLMVSPDVATSDGDPSHLAHILHPRYTTSMLLQARVEGSMVEALCGHRWVPSRDPRVLPLCVRCKEIHAEHDGRPLEYS